MLAYRHWKKKYADDLTERGQIRIMPLTYYADTFDRPGVQDERENEIHVAQRSVIGGSGLVSANDRTLLARIGIFVEGNVTGLTAVGNKAIFKGAPIYVLCLTSIATPGIFAPDDEVTLIPDVDMFAAALLKASDGKFQRVEQGQVRYHGGVQYVEDGPVKGPDPFLKWPEFAYQAEIRIALFPAADLNGPLFLKSERLREALAH
jgi:hypothetical protein